MTILNGKPASPGLNIGRVVIIDPDRIDLMRRTIPEDEIEREISRFQAAIADTIGDLRKIKENVSREIGSEQAEIFETHLMMLQDSALIQSVIDGIRTQRRNADLVFYEMLRVHHDALHRTEDEYLRERASDIRDIGRRVIRKMQGRDGLKSCELEEPSVIAARELTPSMTVTLDRSKVLGFMTELGGRTSHAAILAKALEVPSVVGISDLMQSVKTGDTSIIDGTHGRVILNPDEGLLRQYEQEREDLSRFTKSLETEIQLAAETIDGRIVELAANIELPEEVDSVIAHGAQGIGLFRTEYLFMFRNHLPDEEEQYKEYLTIAERVAPNPVIIRTIDLGGDKILGLTGEFTKEANPFLGWRSIRYCLSNPAIFRTQLRAILRSSVQSNVRIMFPLISSLTELWEAKKHVERTKDELRNEGIPFNDAIKLGIMIETPSAALTAEYLAREVHFFSIGTNDLVQYVLAVDRTNTKVSNLYQFFHPSVLKLIKHTIEAGHAHNIWVGMCGEMAGDPLATILLLGMGLDEFSVSPAIVPEIKKIIRSSNYGEARDLSAQCLKMDTAEAVEEYLGRFMTERFPDIPI